VTLRPRSCSPSYECGKKPANERITEPDGGGLGNVKAEAWYAAYDRPHPLFERGSERLGFRVDGQATSEFVLLLGVIVAVDVFGGAVRLTTQATIGPVSLRVAGGTELDIRCDLALIGVGTISVDVGYSTSNVGEAAMMRDMMSRAARVAILADSSKFGRRLFAQISELGSADYLVTDSKPPPDLLDALSENGVEVITPETASSSS
jgi:hypothetical protein